MADFQTQVLHHATEIRAIVERNRAVQPRLFGSVARNEDGPESDIDILVDTMPGCTLLNLATIEIELEALLGRRVDVRTPMDLHRRIRSTVLQQAIRIESS